MKPSLTYKKRKAITGVIFALPTIIGIVFFFLTPLAQSLIMALSDVFFDRKSGGGLIFEPNQFGNFLYIFTEHADYTRKLTESIMNMVTNAPIIIMFSFFAANLINDKFPFRNIVRVIFFLPIILASNAMMTIDTGDMLQQSMRNFGFRNMEVSQTFLQSFKLSELLLQFGLPNELILFLTSAVDRVYQIISLSGVQILILLAALQSISPSLYEAAHVEGASGWEKFWIVTFPMVSSPLLLCTVYTIIDSFIAYNNPIMLLTKNEMSNMRYGCTSAMSWTYFVIIACILGLVVWIGSKLVFTYDKE